MRLLETVMVLFFGYGPPHVESLPPDWTCERVAAVIKELNEHPAFDVKPRTTGICAERIGKP